MDDNLYSTILTDTDRPTPMLHWYCSTPFNKVAHKLFSGMLALQEEVEKLTTEAAAASAKISHLADGKLPQGMIVYAVKEIGESHDASTESVPLARDLLDSKAKEHMAELENRVRRCSNLVKNQCH